MPGDKDYRNSEYCPDLAEISMKKENLEKEIRKNYPRTKILYNKIKNRDSEFHKKFAHIYNKKCAYCGAMCGLLPIESFEVDHFLNEASFLDTTEGRIEAGKLENLVWSCISCNRGKQGITIEDPYDKLLNVDNGNISKIFVRDDSFYIKINDTYKNDEFIKKFYNALHLGYETRRLDYLELQLEGAYREEKDEERKKVLGKALSVLMKNRNTMTVKGRTL